MSARRIVILTDGHSDPICAKTAVCLLRYCPDEVVGILDAKSMQKTAGAQLGVGGDTPIAARLSELPSADTLVIGIAPTGGRIPRHWKPIIADAIRRRMNVVSGLHEFLQDDAELSKLASDFGVKLQDLRQNDERDVARGEGIRDDCLRLLTVGQDCSIGKMVVAVELTAALKRRGQDAKFLATGQTGILVSGEGCPVDRVIADFLAGAMEKMVLRNQHHDVLVIEGQGGISHPKYSAVTLGLMHGSRPQGMILCYEAERSRVHGMEHVRLRPLSELLAAYEMVARLVSLSRIIAVAANTRRMNSDTARAEIQRVEKELGLPACDVIRDGADRLVDAVLARREELLAMKE